MHAFESVASLVTISTYINRYHVKSVNIWTKRERAVIYPQNCQTRNLNGLAVHLLELPSQDLCSNPSPQSKGHRVPLLDGVFVRGQAPR